MAEHSSHPVVHLPIAWDSDRLVIENPATVKRIARERLSPSTAKSMEGCPARWAVEKMISGQEDPFGPAPLGTHAHAVMENLLALPSEARTIATAADLTISQLARFAAPRADTSRGSWPGIDPDRAPEWVRLVTECWSGLFNIEDPKMVDPFGMEVKLDGVEIEGVPFAGFIDRVDNVLTRTGEPRLRLIDYKSGKQKWAPRGQAHPHDDQLRLYILAMAAKLDLPTSHFTASVYYTKLKFSKERKVSAPRAKLSEVSRRFVKSWEQLNRYTEEASFPCVTSPLCGWCPLVSTCPAAAAAGLVARLDGLPTAEQLPVRVISELDSVSFLASMEKRKAGPAEVDPFADDEHLNALADAYAGVPAAPKAVIDDDVIDVETDPELAAVDPDAAVLPENLDDVERDVHEVIVDFPGIADITAHVLNETRTPDREGTDPMTNALLREDKPYEETAGPASGLNPNSYAATAAFGIVSMAVKTLETNGLPLSRSLVTEMSQVLAAIVANVQTEFTARTSFQDGMHTRLRGALHAALESSPMPTTGDPDDLTAWIDSLTKRTRAIATAAITLWDQGAAEMPELTALTAATSKLRAA